MAFSLQSILNNSATSCLHCARDLGKHRYTYHIMRTVPFTLLTKHILANTHIMTILFVAVLKSVQYSSYIFASE